MIYEPIIKVHQTKFAESFEYQNEAEDRKFEKFINYSELLQHQPDAFMSDLELLDLISVGGGSDGGIDGLAIKVNGFFIKSTEEIDNFLKSGNQINIEFFFIQSKNQRKFECSQIANFINGIRAFFDTDSNFPFNESITYWRSIKDYLYNDDIILQWRGTPIIRCYYVTLGEVREHSEHTDLVRRFSNDMKEVCEQTFFNFHGARELRDIIEQNQNKLKVSLPFIDTMALPGSSDVGDSCVVLCNAADYVGLITTKGEGIIKKTLFNDNVRDFQGENSVNDEILETICHSPEKFVLFNNGITIVCSSFKSANRILEIENPQIVNGCQTSYILYNANEKQADLKSVSLVVKVISTNNPELSNAIVRGTNRQNIVLEEAFESTKPFHKTFELFVNDYVADFSEKIYYERRAKQYAGNLSIKQSQKFNLRILTQYSVAALLQKPYKAHLHESYLLKLYKDQLFKEEHSCLPYFAVAYSFITLEKLIKEGCVPKYFIKYKAHLLMIYFKILGGKKIDLSNERSSDKYANAVLAKTFNLEDSKQIFQQAIEIFREAEHYWIHDLHRSLHVMKEAQIFTDLLIKKMDNIPLDSLEQELSKLEASQYGEVVKIVRSQSKPFGFIRNLQNNEEIFFSCKRNPQLNVKGLLHKTVSFNATLKDGRDRRQAINIKIVTV